MDNKQHLASTPPKAPPAVPASVPSPEPIQPKDPIQKIEPVMPAVPGKPGRKFSPVMIGVIAAAVVLLVVLILAITGGGRSSSMRDALPTQREMASDCSALLKAGGISGSVINVEVTGENLSEKFKTYVVTCTALVSENGNQTQYELSLYYEYDDSQWVLGELSEIKS